MRGLLTAVFVSITLSVSAWAELGTGLQTSAAVDVTGAAGLHKDSGALDRLNLRGAEIMLYGPIDHLFDGTLSFAAHAEGGGVPEVGLHEAWVGSTKLIPRSRFRVGLFFPWVGRLQMFHQHDWPFITAPKVHRTFFADEGILDTGAEYHFLTPLPFFLELTVGVTNGFIFGHDHSAGSRPLFPTHYTKITTSPPMPFDGESQMGLNYVGRRDDTGKGMTLLGVDFTAKWKEATVNQFLLQSEFWYRIETPRGLPSINSFGLYVYPQYYLGSNLFLGMRFDYFTVLNEKDGFGNDLKNREFNFVPTITYRNSEFAQFRLAYNHEPKITDAGTDTKRYLEAQAVFILGAHPAHDF